MENLDCNFCQMIVDDFDNHVVFDDKPTDRLVRISMIESLGRCFGCGDEKFTCLPLIKIMSGEYE